jgi:hypothetical protein
MTKGKIIIDSKEENMNGEKGVIRLGKNKNGKRTQIRMPKKEIRLEKMGKCRTEN